MAHYVTFFMALRLYEARQMSSVVLFFDTQFHCGISHWMPSLMCGNSCWLAIRGTTFPRHCCEVRNLSLCFLHLQQRLGQIEDSDVAKNV